MSAVRICACALSSCICNSPISASRAVAVEVLPTVLSSPYRHREVAAVCCCTVSTWRFNWRTELRNSRMTASDLLTADLLEWASAETVSSCWRSLVMTASGPSRRTSKASLGDSWSDDGDDACEGEWLLLLLLECWCCCCFGS